MSLRKRGRHVQIGLTTQKEKGQASLPIDRIMLTELQIGCDMTGTILPISEYDHCQGSAVIGGYVYKGAQIASLTNLYMFGDLSSGKIWYLREGPPGTFTQTLLLTVSFEVSSFGQDTAGEIYILDYSGGNVLKLSPK